MTIRGLRIAIYVRAWSLPARRVGWLGILALNMTVSAGCAVYGSGQFIMETDCIRVLRCFLHRTLRSVDSGIQPFRCAPIGIK
jgi:hypothetical protein